MEEREKIGPTFILCIAIWILCLFNMKFIKEMKKDIAEIKQEAIMHDTICLEPATDTIWFDETNN